MINLLVNHELDPIYDKSSKVLILGSIPSVKSRASGFYYAHPTNRFWPILENLFNTKLSTKEEKIKFLHDNNIALWDVFKSCDIKASSDATIKNYELNDIDQIVNYASIKAIFCTGKRAFNTLVKYYQTNIPIFYLPSPSSANATLKLNELIKEYSKIKKYVTEP